MAIVFLIDGKSRISRISLACFVLVLAGLAQLTNAAYIVECNENQLKRCADNAEPLLKDKELVVPDSQRSVNQVCSLWVDLTNCIGNYTQRCMSRQQRMEFNRTFKEPASSMSSLCQNQEHRKEYLSHAPCVKKISTEGNFCGNQYRFLIDLVSGSTSTMKQICCARAKFRNCILNETPKRCDIRRPGQLNEGRRLPDDAMNATTMAVSILDKSLAFISQRCSSSRFQEADCPGIVPVTRFNSKGPLESHELETAASGETSHVGTPQSQFQLGQRPAIGDRPLLSVGTTTSSTPSSKSYSGTDPKTDKLSSSSTNYRPAKPDGKANGDEEKKNSGNALHAVKLWKFSLTGLTTLLAVLFTSNKYFTC